VPIEEGRERFEKVFEKVCSEQEEAPCEKKKQSISFGGQYEGKRA